VTAAVTLLAAFLLPLCASAGSIFDDNWTPPMPEKPAMPRDQAPEIKPTPEPAKPGPATPDQPQPTPANVPPPAAPEPATHERKPIPPRRIGPSRASYSSNSM
jgi:hypothetical protein